MAECRHLLPLHFGCATCNRIMILAEDLERCRTRPKIGASRLPNGQSMGRQTAIDVFQVLGAMTRIVIVPDVRAVNGTDLEGCSGATMKQKGINRKKLDPSIHRHATMPNFDREKKKRRQCPRKAKWLEPTKENGWVGSWLLKRNGFQQWGQRTA